MECLFCKIANKEIQCEFVYEDEDIVSFNDINPQAKSHILTVSKKHFSNIKDLNEREPLLANKLIKVASRFGEEFKLQFNTGESAGQTVMHVHAHTLID